MSFFVYVIYGALPQTPLAVQYFASQSNLRLVGHLPDYSMKKASQKLLFACGVKSYRLRKYLP